MGKGVEWTKKEETGKWWGAMMRRMLDEQLSEEPKTTQLNRVNEGHFKSIHNKYKIIYQKYITFKGNLKLFLAC